MSNKEARKAKLLEMPIAKLIPQMAIPTIIAQLITTIYNLVDTYFVSTLGTNATAAVGVNSSLERIITLMAMLIGAGASSYIARLIGAKEEEHANRVFNGSFAAGLSSGLLMAVIGLMVLKKLVYILGATPECATYSVQYGSYVLLAAPFMITSMILNMCLRSEGSATYSMIGMGFGGILNCFLDPLFIYKFNLGVAGASMATAISKTISFLILLWPYLQRKTVVVLAWKYLKFAYEDVKEVVAIGATSFFRSITGIVAAVLLNRIAGSYSTAALAAISVGNRILMFPFGIILGFGQGYQPVVGANWGAKNYKRVKESLNSAVKVSIIGSWIMAAILIVFAKPIIHAFNSQADAEVLRLGVMIIRCESAVLWCHSWLSITNMFYSGIGKAIEGLIMSTARQGYCFFIMIAILPKMFGINGVALCQTAADVLSLAMTIPMFLNAYKLINRVSQ